jgi:hypothetical protein
LTASPSDARFAPEIRAQFIAILEESGCRQVMVRYDGRRIVLDGDACSFERKVFAVRSLQALTQMPILNCIRVNPA